MVDVHFTIKMQPRIGEFDHFTVRVLTPEVAEYGHKLKLHYARSIKYTLKSKDAWIVLPRLAVVEMVEAWYRVSRRRSANYELVDGKDKILMVQEGGVFENDDLRVENAKLVTLKELEKEYGLDQNVTWLEIKARVSKPNASLLFGFMIKRGYNFATAVKDNTKILVAMLTDNRTETALESSRTLAERVQTLEQLFDFIKRLPEADLFKIKAFIEEELAKRSLSTRISTLKFIRRVE